MIKILAKSIAAALATGVGAVQRLPVTAQFYAVAKGLIDPADVRVGGTLTPEQSESIISMLYADDFLSKVTTVRMSKLSKTVDVWDVLPRTMVRVAQGTEPTSGQMPDLSEYGCTLTAKEGDLFPTITLDTLQDNADNPQFVGVVNAAFNENFSSNILDLAFNGTADDYAGSAWLALNKGWIQLAIDSANSPKVTIAPGTLVKATAAVGVVANNNAVTFTAQPAGGAGNSISISMLDPGAISQSLAVTVTGFYVQVSLATDGSGVITSTAAQVIAAVNADVQASALIVAANTAGSTGAGVVTAAPMTPLTGGKVSGWIDALASLVQAADPRAVPQSVFIMNPLDADAYAEEFRALPGDQSKRPVITCRYMPQGRVLYTPPKNLLVGMHKNITRTGAFHARRRAFEMTLSTHFDFEIAVKQFCVLGKPA